LRKKEGEEVKNTATERNNKKRKDDKDKDTD